MQDQERPEQPKVAQQEATPQQAHADSDYYKQLREGTRDFDPQTAQALLMQVDMEANRRSKDLAAGQKHISLVSALIMPWRLFDPAAPSSARRIAFVLLFVVILSIAGYMLPSFLK